ncbi:MAG: aminotransferase class V-fold PLP-dependent enzyme [Enhygromyxa sp.]
MDRRDFLIGSTLLTGAACARPRTSEPSEPPPSEPAWRPDSWTDVRGLFDLDPDYVHMAGLLLASHPRPVREAIEGHRRGLDRNPALYYETHGHALHEQARAAAARFLAVPSDEVALTDSTTMGLGMIYGGLRLAPGSEILTTTHDHYSTHQSLEFNARRTGAQIRKLPLFADHRARAADVDDLVERIISALSPQTRLLALTWVHSSSGLRLPIRAVADALAHHNADREPDERVLLGVDGVHGFGVEAATIPELGCDIFVAGCHKWIFGPRGTGLAWAREPVWARVDATIPAFEIPVYTSYLRGQPIPREPGGVMHTPGGFHSFEMRWSLPVAFELHDQIGRPRIEARIHDLARALEQGLAAMPHVTLHTPMADALSSGLVCFEVAGHEPAVVVERLREQRIIASTTPYVPSYARLTPGLCNDEADIERALAAVAALR